MAMNHLEQERKIVVKSDPEEEFAESPDKNSILPQLIEETIECYEVELNRSLSKEKAEQSLGLLGELSADNPLILRYLENVQDNLDQAPSFPTEGSEAIAEPLAVSLALNALPYPGKVRQKFGRWLSPRVTATQRETLQEVLIDALAWQQGSEITSERNKREELVDACRLVFSDGGLETVSGRNVDRDGNGEDKKQFIPPQKDLFGVREKIDPKKTADAEIMKTLEDLTSPPLLAHLLNSGIIPPSAAVNLEPGVGIPAGDYQLSGEINDDPYLRSKVAENTCRELAPRFTLFKLLTNLEGARAKSTPVDKTSLYLAVAALDRALDLHQHRLPQMNQSQGESIQAVRDQLRIIREKIGFYPPQEPVQFNPEMLDLLRFPSSEKISGLPSDLPRVIDLMQLAFPGTVAGRCLNPIVLNRDLQTTMVDALDREERFNEAKQIVHLDQELSDEGIQQLVRYLETHLGGSVGAIKERLSGLEEGAKFSKVITTLVRILEEHDVLEPYFDEPDAATQALSDLVMAYDLGRLATLPTHMSDTFLSFLPFSDDPAETHEVIRMAERTKQRMEAPTVLFERQNSRPLFTPGLVEQELNYKCPGLPKEIVKGIADFAWQSVFFALLPDDPRLHQVAGRIGLFLSGRSGSGKSRISEQTWKTTAEAMRQCDLGRQQRMPTKIMTVDAGPIVQSGLVGDKLKPSLTDGIFTTLKDYGFGDEDREAAIKFASNILWLFNLDELLNRIARDPRLGEGSSQYDASARETLQVELLGLLNANQREVSVPVTKPLVFAEGISTIQEQQVPMVLPRAFIGNGSLSAIQSLLSLAGEQEQQAQTQARLSYPANISKDDLRRVAGFRPDLLARVDYEDLGERNVGQLGFAFKHPMGQGAGLVYLLEHLARAYWRQPIAKVEFDSRTNLLIDQYIEKNWEAQYRVLDEAARRLLVAASRDFSDPAAKGDLLKDSPEGKILYLFPELAERALVEKKNGNNKANVQIVQM